MRIQLAIAAACVALLCALGLGWSAATTRAENKRLSATNAALTADLAGAHRLRQADQAVALRYAKRVASLTTTQKATNAKLRQALDSNGTWAGAAVPPDVAAALGMPSPTPAP